ncbi:MAG: ATP synthase F1 subunit epsilon [Bacilli bacterium]
MFTLKIVEPEKLVYEGQVSIVNIRTGEGQLGILTNQAPMIETIIPSLMSFSDANDIVQTLAISSGWLILRDNILNLYVNSSEFKDEIDIERAMNDRNIAQALLEDENLDRIKQVHTRLALEKAINRIEVYNKK